MPYDFLTTFFNSTEIQQIQCIGMKDRRHPIKQLLNPHDNHEVVKANTDRAFTFILNHKNNNWLDRIKLRLLDTQQFSASTSALGELRCYGYLLETGLNVQPISESGIPTPDFKILNDSQEIWIEVNSKQLDEKEEIALSDFNNRKVVNNDNKKFTISEHVVTPFGKPKANENVSESAISKLAQIKNDEKQFSNTHPSILWLDFQDEIWDLSIKDDLINPISTFRGELFIGILWYAFFGYKGAPIFEGHSTEERAIKKIISMRHDGRFRKDTKIDAVIIALPNSTFAIENPWSNKTIPAWFWKKFIFAPWFKIECSRLNWPNNNLKDIIEIEKKQIETFGNMDLFTW